MCCDDRKWMKLAEVSSQCQVSYHSCRTTRLWYRSWFSYWSSVTVVMQQFQKFNESPLLTKALFDGTWLRTTEPRYSSGRFVQFSGRSCAPAGLTCLSPGFTRLVSGGMTPSSSSHRDRAILRSKTCSSHNGSSGVCSFRCHSLSHYDFDLEVQ